MRLFGTFAQEGKPQAGSKLSPVDSRCASMFKGVFIIMQTPFLDTLAIDEHSLRHEVRFLIECGVHGFVWPAAASEAPALSYTERLKYSEVICREADEKIPIVIGVTAANKFEAAEYASHAERIGARAVLTLPQTDMSPTDPHMFEEYISAIASSCALPIFVQTSYPGYPSALTPHFLLKLAEKVPTFKYVKEEQVGMGPLPWRISEYVKGDKRIITPMAGAGARNLFNEMARGSLGTMPGAGFADVQVKIWNWFHTGKKREARELFSKMLMMAVLEQSTGYVLQKEILRRRGVFQTITIRSTRRTLMDDGDMLELDDIFETLQPYFLPSDG